MASEKTAKVPEQDAFLAMVDAKIAALQTLRASYVAAASVGAMAQAGDIASLAAAGGTAGLGGAPLELPRGALLSKSLPAAIKLYLSSVKRKQTIKEIAQALKDGGVETTAANFENPVTSAINRLKATGEVLRFNDGWALAEFYPESLRNRISKDKEAKPTKKGKKNRTKASAKKTAPEARQQREVKSERPPATDKAVTDKTAAAIRILTALGATGVNIPELLAELEKAGVPCERKYVRGILSKLYLQGKAEKHDGRYILKLDAPRKPQTAA